MYAHENTYEHVHVNCHAASQESMPMEGSVRALLDGALVHTWDAHGILSVTLFLDRVRQHAHLYSRQFL